VPGGEVSDGACPLEPITPVVYITRAPAQAMLGGQKVFSARLHLVSRYAEQRVDRPYHHVYDPASDRWTGAAPLPRRANHVGVVCMDSRLYAVGGFIE
jgi:hypothetical protein